MSDFWETDTPTREDEAFELLQFGAIQVNDDSEYPAAIARTERRMLNCAKFYTKQVATIESEVAALRAEVENWKESAAQFSRNADFYRGLIVKIGETFGAEAKTADDGTLQDDVLALKVPELVDGMREDAERLNYLQSRLLAADFDYGEQHETVLVLKWPRTGITADMRKTIDLARKESSK